MTTNTKQTTTTPNSPFSLTYGEETKLPLAIHAASFHVMAARAQKLALIEARLTVCNDSINKEIEVSPPDFKRPRRQCLRVCTICLRHATPLNIFSPSLVSLAC